MCTLTQAAWGKPPRHDRVLKEPFKKYVDQTHVWLMQSYQIQRTAHTHTCQTISFLL